MKTLIAITTAIGIALILFGTPLAETPKRANHYNSPRPILPMSFAHADHGTVTCATCHHDFIDNTGPGLCMNCHVTHPQVAPLLEEQFHTLCRDCHVDLTANNEPAGPTRECQACHHQENEP